jgi:photosystem II stability/assembly factor-like uncharacterized protein
MNSQSQLSKKTYGRATTACLFLLLFAQCSLPDTFASPGTWSKQRASSLAWLHTVFFLDQNRGWAAGSRGTLLATADGGASWQIKPKPTEDSIRDLYFSDERNGWLICERNIYDLKSNDEPRAYLMKTGDGGEHWQRMNLRGANVDARLTRAIFSPGPRAWTFGEGGALYTTYDAGSSWTKLQTPTRYLLLGGDFIDDRSGWLVGAGATILLTSDGGENWQRAQLSAAANARLNAASFVNARQGWVVGSSGAIYHTVNGGRSWQSQNPGITADLMDVKFLDALEGWAVGEEGTVLHTTDGGLHWQSERSLTPHPLERIFFTDRTHGWAVGFGGTIISYNSGRVAVPTLQLTTR